MVKRKPGYIMIFSSLVPHHDGFSFETIQHKCQSHSTSEMAKVMLHLAAAVALIDKITFDNGWADTELFVQHDFYVARGSLASVGANR